MPAYILQVLRPSNDAYSGVKKHFVIGCVHFSIRVESFDSARLVLAKNRPSKVLQQSSLHIFAEKMYLLLNKPKNERCGFFYWEDMGIDR